MNHRTLLLTLFVAGALSTTAAFAQDATAASQQTPPVSAQADASAQQSATDASATTTSGDASAAASDQVQTSGDASGMATNASTSSSYDSSATTDQDKDQKDKVYLDIHMVPYFPAKNFMIALTGQKGDDLDAAAWAAEYAQQ